MNVKVISISKELEPILCFLFPTYSLVQNLSTPTNFIVHHDVTSKYEKERLGYAYSNGIIISSQIFDEVWDEKMVIEKCVEFSRVNFKNRKTKLEPGKETFVEDCIGFVFQSNDEEFDSSINGLFESFGSTTFSKNFIQLSETIPVAVLHASLSTFVSKVLNPSETSVYYKKKSFILKDKITANFNQALEDFSIRTNDSYGLSILKFYSDLFK